MNAQPNSAAGFSAPFFYKMGQKYGLTCSEIMVNFLGKSRALSRGKYPAVAPTDPQETSRKNKAASTKPLKAAAKKVKSTKQKDVITDTSVPNETESELRANDVPTNGEVFVYIATPEEIAE